MNSDLARGLDRFLGVPCSLLLGLYLRLRELFPRPAPTATLRRVLFILVSETGSLVVAQPAVAHARRRFPGAELFFLCSREGGEVLRALGVGGAQVVEVRTDRVGSLLLDTLRALRRLRRLRLDATVNLEAFLRFPEILACLSGAPRRAGYHRFCDEGNQSGGLLTHRVIYNPHLHAARSYVALVEALDEPPDEEPRAKVALDAIPLELPRHRPSGAIREAVLAALRRLFPGLEPGWRIVLLNPNAGDRAPMRRWPGACFREVALGLLRLPRTLVVLTGSLEERGAVERLRREIGSERAVSLAGRTTLEELLALCHESALLITNDSGPAHFAALTPVPVLVLFGPETPRIYAPLGPGARVLYAELACSPCLTVHNRKRSRCRENRCMTAITPEEVLEAASALLAPQRGASPGGPEGHGHGGGGLT